MTGMCTSLKVLMHCFRTGWIMNRLRILALKIRGENRMNRAAVNMTRIPMMMICIGMHVEEWNYQHPDGRPYEDQHPRTR